MLLRFMTYSLFAYSLALSDLFLASDSSPTLLTLLLHYGVMLLSQFPLNFFAAQMRDSTVFDYSLLIDMVFVIILEMFHTTVLVGWDFLGDKCVIYG